MAPKAKPSAKGQATATTGGSPTPGDQPDTSAQDEAGMEDYEMPMIIYVTPRDQLQISPEELEKEVPPRVLLPNNPRAAHNITYFSFKDKQFKRDDQVDQCVFHYQVDGAILLKESAEADDMRAIQDSKQKIHDDQQKVEDDAMKEDDFEPVPDEQDKPEKNRLRNQFNFSERAAQTKNSVLRERGWTTAPPPTTQFSATVTQWDIFDQYQREIEAAKIQDKEDKKQKQSYEEVHEKKKSDSDPLYSDSMKLSIKIMERMVNQNAENEVYHDYKYWEDKSDELPWRDGEGTLLPLWRFSSEKAKRKQVTSIKWNPRYNDLCAVGFGSYDFMRQGTGVICCYSLKNTKYPEYVFNTDAGICSLDWHPCHPALLAVGLYDGTVLVYDVRARMKKPIYQSTVRTNKHTDPVWEVRWNVDQSSGNLNFYSISSDGRVSNWFLMKNKLESEEVMELKLMSSSAATSEDDETSLAGLAGGLCFDFNRQSEHLFLVGTEEGRIHKCSKAFSGQYLETYEGHSMAVYTVRWNLFHPKIFISASADWTVKMWDHTNRTPVMSFDLAQAIGDVAWAPLSSTTFAAITSDGFVHIYDLSVNRNDRICSQKVVKRAKLTHVAFNNEEPIIIVGDDRGGTHTLKLSPNLRKTVERNEETDPSKTDEDLQIDKMEHLLEMVTETKET